MEFTLLRSEIEQLLATFAYLLDHGRADETVALFTEDGAFVSPLVTLRGHAELTAGFGARARQTHVTRHLHANLHLRPESDDRARATVALTVYRSPGLQLAPPRPFLVADCEDAYERGPDHVWRIAERTIVPVFMAGADDAAHGAERTDPRRMR